MTLLTLTTIFRAKPLTEVRTACLISACIIPKLSPLSTIVYTYSIQGAKIIGLYISSSSIRVSLSSTAAL
jgi:hypothetical protein